MTILSLELREPQGSEASSPRVTTALPRIWIGYLLAFGFLVVEVVEVVIDPELVDQITLPIFLAWLAGFAYWLYWVYRLHQVLKEATGGRHPIPPGRSVLGHLLPIYNIAFVFRWPNALVDFVNAQLPERRMWKAWVGATLLSGFFVTRFVDAAIGEVILFSVVLYLNRQVA